MQTPPRSSSPADLLESIVALSHFSGRVAGSEGERMAQTWLAGKLHDLGFDAVVEGAVAPAPMPVVLGLHAVVLLLGGLLAPISVFWSLLLTAVATLSFWGELREYPRILRRLLLKRITGNLVARARNPHARARIILCAHADVASSSTLFHPWVKRWTVHREKPGRTVHPGSLVLLAGGSQIVACFVQWAREETSVIALGFALGALLVHVGTLVLAVDWWRSPPVEGAIDNGSGMAVLLGAGQEFSRAPLRDAELWIVATGDWEPDAGGMTAFLSQFAHILDPDRDLVVNVDDVGRGRLHIVRAEGRWDWLAYRPTLPALAERVASGPGFEGIGEADIIGTSDAGAATREGFRAVTLTSLVEGQRPSMLHTHDDTLEAVEPAAVHEALRFVVALLRAADEQLGGSEVGLLTDPGATTEPSAPAV